LSWEILPPVIMWPPRPVKIRSEDMAVDQTQSPPDIQASDSRVADVLGQLARRGMRRTAARQAILEALYASNGHISADDLATDVQRRFPTVNVSTIYRTLEVLQELEIIDHVHLAHGPAVFHLAEHDHQHLVCERCSRVQEVPSDKMLPFLKMLEGEFGFELDRRHFALVGLCETCQEID
jgi:Fur family ferric uptake transcriptional regulator